MTSACSVRSAALAAVLMATLCAGTGRAQTPAGKAARAHATVSTVSAVILSDLHFDPFHDPAKFERLRVAGAAQWGAILAEPESATQAESFAKLNAGCGLRGTDSSPALLESSLAAAHAAAPQALFAMVSGDLMAHEFDCRFKVLAPKASEADYSAFAFRTVAFVALELRRTFGKMPVYVALGNNDSGCGDYRESSGSVFLRALAESLSGELNSPADASTLAKQFPSSGSYSVRLPAPIVRGRLLVLQDMFLARSYKDCSGKADADAATAQLTWLRGELEHARTAHEQVWVMAHIPPGVDVYSTVKNKRDVCGGKAPVFFLGDERLAQVLTDYSDVVRLAVFAHTHNDEMHLLRSSDFAGAAGPDRVVATKLVPSVSPINGNMPSFTVAEVDPRTAAMRDYRVVMASNATGVETHWADEYRFSALYGVTGYTPNVLAKVLDGFVADHDGVAKPSTDYQQKFFVGGGIGSIGVHLVWPSYACSMEHHTEASYRACVCPAKP